MRLADINLRTPIRIGVVLALLGACTAVPELDATLPAGLKNAEYPALVPLETLLLPESDQMEDAETQRSDLEARRDSLKARAARLNTPVVDDETRTRMNAGVTPPG